MEQNLDLSNQPFSVSAFPALKGVNQFSKLVMNLILGD